MGLLQTDERVKSIIKNKQLDYKIVKYEYNKKRHFMGGQATQGDLLKEEQVIFIHHQYSLHSLTTNNVLINSVFVEFGVKSVK